MNRIAPKDRFSRNPNSTTISPELLNDAITQFGLDPDHTSIEMLSGGFMNANFLITSKKRQFVFRVYSTDITTAQREQSILSYLKQTSVLVPTPYALFEIAERPVSVIEYFNSMTLEDCLLSNQTIDLKLYEEIGRQLAQIHQITFQDAGFIDSKGLPGKEYQDFSLFLNKFIEKTLSWLESNPDRLDLDTNVRLQKLIQEQWHLTLEREPSRQLVHTDFNPKNILVSKASEVKVVAIIDWEFCLSGNGLIDFGNFFRFSYDYPVDAREYFEQGYNSIQSLPSNWKEVALLLDLGNMCSFLERKEDYQKSFRTAREVIKGTLEHFGY